VPEAVSRKLEDQLIEIFRRNTERFNQRGLNRVRNLIETILILAPLQNMDFANRHCGVLLVRRKLRRRGDASLVQLIAVPET
jgi:hypothetical protein